MFNRDGNKKRINILSPFFWVALIFIMVFPVLPDLYQDVKINVSYLPSQCTITNKNVSTGSTRGFFNDRQITYIPQINVKQSLGNKTYIAWINVARSQEPITSPGEAQSYLRNYTITSVIPCWYDPMFPAYIAVDRGFHVLEWIFIPCVIVAFLLMAGIASLNAPTGKTYPVVLGGESYQIKRGKWTIEYIYQSDQPLTVDALPPDLKSASDRRNELLVKMFNKNRRYVAIAPGRTRTVLGWMFLISIVATFTLAVLIFGL